MRHVRTGIHTTSEAELKPNVHSTTAIDILKQIAALKKKQKDIIITFADKRELLYTKQTGKFPYHSSKSYKYVIVTCEIYGNVIFTKPMRSRKETEMIRTHKEIMAKLHEANLYKKAATGQ
jgi:hypothetical protein